MLWLGLSENFSFVIYTCTDDQVSRKKWSFGSKKLVLSKMYQ